jgi:hypothetical protein
MKDTEKILEVLERHGEREIAAHLSDIVILRRAARVMAKRKRPSRVVYRPCPLCGEPFGAREMRTHLPVCPKKGTK